MHDRVAFPFSIWFVLNDVDVSLSPTLLSMANLFRRNRKATLSRPPPRPSPPESPYTLGELVEKITDPTELQLYQRLKGLPVNPFRSVRWSDFPEIEPLFKAINLDALLSSKTYTNYSPELSRLFWASISRDAESGLHARLGDLHCAVNGPALAGLLDKTSTGPSVAVLRVRFPIAEVKQFLCDPRMSTYSWDDSLFPPRLLKPLPRMIARILHYTVFPRRNSSGINHVPNDILLMVYALMKGITFDWAEFVTDHFKKTPKSFVPFPNIVSLFASDSIRGFHSSLFIPCGQGNMFTSETISRMGISKVAGSSSNAPGDDDNGDADAESSEEDSQPNAAPSGTASMARGPSRPPQWTFYQGHLTPDFDHDANASMSVLVSGFTSVFDHQNYIIDTMTAGFRNLNSRLDDVEERLDEVAPRRRRRNQ